jgi:hypothetical protein
VTIFVGEGWAGDENHLDRRAVFYGARVGRCRAVARRRGAGAAVRVASWKLTMSFGRPTFLNFGDRQSNRTNDAKGR